MQSNDDGHNFWVQSSQVCFYAAYGTTGLAAVWFAFINFIGDELHHPLDFFSNKMRTRPYWYLLVLAATGGLLGLDMASGYLDELSKTLPELVVCTNLEGFVLVGTMMFAESAGAAMVTMLAHMIITKGLVVIVTIPTAPFMPGAVYSNAYFLLHMFFVFFLKVGAERHARYLVKIEYQSKLVLSEGAERVPQLWARTILRGCPILLVVTDILFLAVYLMSRGEYGKAITILYFITAILMLLGCCSQYKSGTTVE
ncbi:unnamed protein product [Effrenium voratum]|uniref:Uncharacterized protein n=1 Tax=Effrenium voratum TaxID=2562239 RepID=A0AA36HMN6_9DINO|nr:unnamed protein product [Effrenium voratum]CAJ1371975.1 unnamed protein product [Effrenium voratum]CAJ1422283.1 unnamed protein product [Effrenium voratum]|mmetsp:Transcript_28620/g.68091  ORF Transcript_28620/g.68091 Transcript_28620/m.68091 type:complete len:255 (+) Transcript_28620:36-800(+)